MTNHELCLAASKAAGYTVESDHVGWIKRTGGDGLTTSWNPLEYGQDAFRLMVDCHVLVEIMKSKTEAYCWKEGEFFVAEEPHGTDKHAATRRAITRAAAARGDAK